jgi:uncharacterized protein
VNCPICRKEVAPGGPEMPFCGERCRLIDLGNWASGKYVISTPAPGRGEGAEGFPDDEGEGLGRPPGKGGEWNEE